MANLDINLLGEDPWSISEKLFEAIKAHLQSQSATPSLDEYLKIYRSEEDNVLSTFFWNIWEPFHIIAKALPADSPEQDKLVQCLKSIKETTGTVDSVEIDDPSGGLGITYRLWQDMPSFGGTFQEFTSLIYDREGANWQNAMAYAARLTHEGIDDFSQDGINSIAAALEGRIVQRHAHDHPGRFETSFEPGVELDDAILIASNWIRYGGVALFGNIDEKEVVASPGPIWHGGITSQRWMYWKTRFGEVEKDERIIARTRDLAKEAKEMMAKIDGKEVEA